MARTLTIIAAFLIILFGGDRIGGFVLGTLLDHGKESISEMYAGRSQGDVVLTGNSRAYHHFDARFLSIDFGKPVVNLSYPVMTMQASQAVLEDYIELYGPPKILVLELSGLTVEPELLLPDFIRPHTLHSKRLANIFRESVPRDYYATKVSHLFAFNNPYSINTIRSIFSSLDADHLLHGRINDKPFLDGPAENGWVYFNSKPKNIAALEGIIKTVKKHGINLKLVLTPALASYSEANGYLAWREEISKIVGDIPVWDYVIDPPFAAKYFWDPLHLNEQGVGVFRDVLRQDGFFEDVQKAPSR